jgi:proteasome accessory factor B
MPTPSTKLQRWLDLVAYLAGRRLPVSTEHLWRAVPAYEAGLDGSEKEKQTVRRMFERDKDELRKLGIPIDTVPYSINYGREQATGYRMATKDFHLPYMKLMAEAREHGVHAAGGAAGAGASPSASTSDFPITPDEASAALGGLVELSAVPAFPLRSAARSAFRKLAFDLDPSFLRETPVVYAEDPEATATRAVLRLLSGAVQRRKAVRFGYRGMTRDTEEERRVHPFGLLFQHGRWYMIGQDLDRDAVRMFRLGRIRDAREEAPKKGTPDYEVPDDFDLEAYAGRSAWEVGEDPEGPIDAVVRFAFPRSLWAERNGHGALVEEHEDGTQLRRFRILRRDPFLRWILSLVGDARVEQPESLKDEFTALAREVVRRHEPNPTETS